MSMNILNDISKVYLEQVVDEGKADKKLPDYKRSGARLARYANPSGAEMLGGGQQTTRRAEHEERRGVKKEEFVEEGLRSAVKRLLGGGKKEAEAPKPESRGAQLRTKYNVGPEKSDTSAKRQILDRSRAKAEKDEKEFGGSKYSKLVAQKSKAAHDSYLKAGYSKYGADDARGRGSKAAKRAASLNREEFEFVVNALIEEGYDLSSYTYDEMYEVCLDEAVKGASRHDTEMRKAAATEKKAGAKNRLSPSKGKDNANKMQSDINYFDKLTKKNKNVVGLVTKEEVEIFDTILEYLVAEGYADTNESALVIMANMSEEWRQSIVEVKLDPRGRPASGPMNVYANPKGKQDQAHLDAVKAYDEKQKKKTPEQRKAELDAYRERQMNNK